MPDSTSGRSWYRLHELVQLCQTSIRCSAGNVDPAFPQLPESAYPEKLLPGAGPPLNLPRVPERQGGKPPNFKTGPPAFQLLHYSHWAHPDLTFCRSASVAHGRACEKCERARNVPKRMPCLGLGDKLGSCLTAVRLTRPRVL